MSLPKRGSFSGPRFDDEMKLEPKTQLVLDKMLGLEKKEAIDVFQAVLLQKPKTLTQLVGHFGKRTQDEINKRKGFLVDQKASGSSAGQSERRPSIEGDPRHPLLITCRSFSVTPFPYVLNTHNVPAIVFGDAEFFALKTGEKTAKGGDRCTFVFASFSLVKPDVDDFENPGIVFNTQINYQSVPENQFSLKQAHYQKHDMDYHSNKQFITPEVFYNTLDALRNQVIAAIFWGADNDIIALRKTVQVARNQAKESLVDQTFYDEPFSIIDIQLRASELLKPDVPEVLKKFTDKLKLDTALCALRKQFDLSSPEWLVTRTDQWLRCEGIEQKGAIHSSLEDAKAVCLIFHYLRKSLNDMLPECW